MWYLIWIFGTFFACILSVIITLVLERRDFSRTNKEKDM